MTEALRKALLYFQPVKTYWKCTGALLDSKQLILGHYPLSIYPRIVQGHYPYFDKDGIPCFPNEQGHMIHHYTTMCSYALAHWEKLLVNKDSQSEKVIIKIADYLIKSAIWKDEVALFLDFEDTNEDSGGSCAMNQGEAISVLLRTYILTNDSKYLNLAKSASKSFNYPYGEKGVTMNLADVGVWFLEGGKYILNGHNYAVWGLYELNLMVESSETKALFDQGWKSVERALPLFDAGYWSWYWADEPRYMATIMYHNLHIVQLEHIAQVSGSEIIGSYARKFERYAANPVNRILSAATVFKSKVSR